MAVGAPLAGGARLVVDRLSVPSPLYPRRGSTVSGYAHYEIDGLIESYPAQGVDVSAVVDANTYASGRTDMNGLGRQGVVAPAEPGIYVVTMAADDCSGQIDPVSASGVMQVVPAPFGGDVWTESLDIHFEGEIDSHPQVASGTVFNVYADVHYSVNQPTSIVARVYDVYFECSGGFTPVSNELATASL